MAIDGFVVLWHQWVFCFMAVFGHVPLLRQGGKFYP